MTKYTPQDYARALERGKALKERLEQAIKQAEKAEANKPKEGKAK